MKGWFVSMEKINAIDINNNVIECEVVLMCTNPQNNNIYMIYTDNTKNEQGQLELLCSRIEEMSENMKLFPLTDEEWAFIEKQMDNISTVLKNNLDK